MSMPDVRPGRIARNVSVATRLSLVALLVAMLSLLVTTIVGLRQGTDLAEDLLRNRLVTSGASRASQVEGYINGVHRRTQSLALSPQTAQNINKFGDAYRILQGSEPTVEQEGALTQHYRSDVVPELQAVRSRDVGLSEVLPTSAAAVNLQSSYVVPDGPDAPPPSLLDDAGDGSAWTELHKDLHPIYRDIARSAGFDELYLVDARNDTIVYSVRKGIDFATSLNIGPLSGTTISSLVDDVIGKPVAGSSAIADYAQYQAAGDRPVAFIASPVFDGDVVIGAVVARIDTSDLGAIMTNSGNWDSSGATEETYIVDDDATMRSDARGFIEDPDSYFALSAEQTGLSHEDQNAIDLTDTTVTLQSVDDSVVRAAAEHGSGTISSKNYMGLQVLTSYRQLALEGLDWVLFAETGQAELQQPIVDYARDLLITVAVFLVVLTFIVVGWSNRLVAPLRSISARLRTIQGSPDAGENEPATEMPPGSPIEFVGLADDIDVMLQRLDERKAELDQRTTERNLLLHKFLPPVIARRAEAGERDVLDQSPHATVLVMVFRGLGELIRAQSKEDTRNELDHIIEEADALARTHGIDRMKLTGDAYYAACGTSRPYLDHAPRSVSFVLEVSELLKEFSSEVGHEISVSVGLDSGPVTVGLTGGARLVYDTWGSTVTKAAHLARMASSGQILVSGEALDQLPSSFTTATFEAASWAGKVAEVTGRSATKVDAS